MKLGELIEREFSPRVSDYLNPHIAPTFCCGRRITRRGGAYSSKPLRHSVSYAFSVFLSVRPATTALRRPRDERRCNMRINRLMQRPVLRRADAMKKPPRGAT